MSHFGFGAVSSAPFSTPSISPDAIVFVSGVSATMLIGNYTVTTVVFDYEVVKNLYERRRTAYVLGQQPRVAYVLDQQPRIVYVPAKETDKTAYIGLS